MREQDKNIFFLGTYTHTHAHTSLRIGKGCAVNRGVKTVSMINAFNFLRFLRFIHRFTTSAQILIIGSTAKKMLKCFEDYSYRNVNEMSEIYIYFFLYSKFYEFQRLKQMKIALQEQFE